MTNVTVLTKELVEQFEYAVGRRVTAAEYMELRRQAVVELSAGYSISDMPVTNSFIPATNNPAVNPIQTNPDASNPSLLTPVTRQSEQSAVMTQNVAIPDVTPVLNPVPSVPVTPVPTVEAKLNPTPIAAPVSPESTPVPTPVPKVNVAPKAAIVNTAPIQTDSNTDNGSSDFFKLVQKFMV